MAAKADGNSIRTQRTRARILAEGLRLFNARGEANVTTGMIAAGLEMSPGNLYYHFRNKDQIVEQLFAQFEERIDVQPRAPAGSAPGAAPWGPAAIEDLWLYLHLMFEGIWEYRFLYRNLDDLVTRNRRLRGRFNRIIDAKFDTVVSLCEDLVRARVMVASPKEIRTLARNVLVVATYWLNYQAVRDAHPAGSSSSPDMADLGQGAFQVMALVAPYLLGESREHLDRLGRNYID